MENNLPLEELLHEEESTSLDFKQESYKFTNASDYEKSELLKDLLAFANAWRRTEAYILIGVKEIKAGRSLPLGIEDDLDDAQLQQFINSKTNKPINFSYTTHLKDDKKIGIIKILSQDRPFYTLKTYGKVKAQTVYIRRGSSTTEASPDEIFEMGKAVETVSEPTPQLLLEFANRKDRKQLGPELKVETTFLDGPPFKEIKDYQGRNTYPLNHFDTVFSTLHTDYTETPRPEYYQELVEYHFFLACTKSFNLAISNISTVSVTDIKIEISMTIPESGIKVSTSNPVPKKPESHINSILQTVSILNSRNQPNQTLSGIMQKAKESIEIHELDSSIQIDINLAKIQPKQTIFLDELLYISAVKSLNQTADVTIYGDNIPTPLKQSLTFCVEVTELPGELHDILNLENGSS